MHSSNNRLDLANFTDMVSKLEFDWIIVVMVTFDCNVERRVRVIRHGAVFLMGKRVGPLSTNVPEALSPADTSSLTASILFLVDSPGKRSTLARLCSFTRPPFFFLRARFQHRSSPSLLRTGQGKKQQGRAALYCARRMLRQ